MSRGRALALGWRMARSAVRTRPAVVVATAAGSGVGSVILAVAFALTPRIAAANACAAGDTLCQGRVHLSVLAVLATPGVLLCTSTTRVSADLRTRQSRHLLILGLPPGFVRTAAVTESWLLTLPSTVLGAGVALLLMTTLFAEPARVAGPPVATAVVVGMVVSLASASSAVSSAGARAARPARRLPGVQRLGVLAASAGVLALLVAAGLPRSAGAATGTGPADLRLAVWTAGTVLALLGLPAAVGPLARWCGRLLSRHAPWPSARVAGHVLSRRPASVGRVLGTYVGVLLVAILALSVWHGFGSSASTRAALDAESGGGPNYALATFADPVSTVGTLREADAVRGAEPWHLTACDDGACVNVLIADCDQLAFFRAAADLECDPGSILHLAGTPDPRGHRMVPEFDPGAAALDVPVAAPIRTVDRASLGVQGGLEVTAVVPPGLVSPSPGRSARWVLALAPGHAAVDALAAANPAAHVVSLAGGTEAYRQAVGVRDVLLGVVLSGLLATLSSLVLAAIDRGVERRELVDRLHDLGAPRAFTRRALLWEQLLPATVATVAATGVGALAAQVGLYDPVDAGSPVRLALTTGAAGGAAVALFLVGAVGLTSVLHVRAR